MLSARLINVPLVLAGGKVSCLESCICFGSRLRTDGSTLRTVSTLDADDGMEVGCETGFAAAFLLLAVVETTLFLRVGLLVSLPVLKNPTDCFSSSLLIAS